MSASSVSSLGGTPQLIPQVLNKEVGIGLALTYVLGIDRRATSLLCLLPKWTCLKPSWPPLILGLRLTEVSTKGARKRDRLTAEGAETLGWGDLADLGSDARASRVSGAIVACAERKRKDNNSNT
jgi:hypothetical protein